MSEQTPTFNQINEQFSNEQPATILVERNDETISTAQIMGQGEHGARAFFANLNEEVTEKRIPTKTVSLEKLSDQHQEKLAEKLAGAALLGAEVKPEYDSKTFDAEAANLERSMNEALEQKRLAQQGGRGEDSIYWGQQAGQYSRQLAARRKQS